MHLKDSPPPLPLVGQNSQLFPKIRNEGLFLDRALILFAELTKEEERKGVVATGGEKKVLGGCATIAGWGHK